LPPPGPRRKSWTRQQLAPLEASGFFKDERLELVEGELISKMGKHRPHVIAAMSMLFWLADCFGKSFAEAQAPIDVSPEDNPTSEPEPDVVVLRRDRAALARNPQPEDVLLLVEVSDSTLTYDLTVKAGLYARAAITEYWVLDINGRRVIVHRNPAAGQYSSVVSYSEHETLSPVTAPEVSFSAHLVLPPLS
jgi:Uma2 family endonuclease